MKKAKINYYIITPVEEYVNVTDEEYSILASDDVEVSDNLLLELEYRYAKFKKGYMEDSFEIADAEENSDKFDWCF